MNNQEIICRCEEVTLEDLQEAIGAGATTSQELKMATRAGMGMCQGRICRSLLDALVPANQKENELLSGTLTYHKPVRPVPLASIAKKENSI